MQVSSPDTTRSNRSKNNSNTYNQNQRHQDDLPFLLKIMEVDDLNIAHPIQSASAQVPCDLRDIFPIGNPFKALPSLMENDLSGDEAKENTERLTTRPSTPTQWNSEKEHKAWPSFFNKAVLGAGSESRVYSDGENVIKTDCAHEQIYAHKKIKHRTSFLRDQIINQRALLEISNGLEQTKSDIISDFKAKPNTFDSIDVQTIQQMLEQINFPTSKGIHWSSVHNKFLSVESKAPLDSIELLDRVTNGDFMLDNDLLLSTMLKLALALEIMRRIGVVNRDIKLENILIDQLGTITILDFGFALLKKNHSDVAAVFKNAEDKAQALGAPASDFSEKSKMEALKNISEPFRSCGSPNYMPPEVIRAHAATHRSDVWSMGILFFALTTNSLPFDGQKFGRQELYRAIRYSNAPLHLIKRDHLTYPLRDLIAGMLVKEQDFRSQPMEIISKVLELYR